jgi:uncharacterized membrane protein
LDISIIPFLPYDDNHQSNGPVQTMHFEGGTIQMEKTLEHSAAAASSQTRKLVLTALFAAMACVATMLIRVPSPTDGYMNLGDTVVLLGAYLLGPLYGAAAGGIGSALADLLAGYPMYVPATLVIKAVMALVAGLLYKTIGKTSVPGVIACGVVGEVPMVVGYWLFDAILATSAGQSFGVSLAGTAIGIPSNLVQAGFGIAVSTLLALALRKSSYVRRTFPTL